MSSVISCVAWVKRGVAAQQPTKYNLDEKELERVSALARIELEDARIELERAHEAAQQMGKGAEEEEEADESDDMADEANEEEHVSEDDRMDEDGEQAHPKPTSTDPNDLSAYKLDDYDKETKQDATGLFSNIKGLTYYKDNEEDPYITLKEDDDDEREELQILPSDNLIVTAKTEDDISQLEIYVYDEREENLYVHHDLMLPAFPLCLEWLDFPPAGPQTTETPTKQFGNYIAVGTFDPEIEIWSLDTVEAMYPDAILGRPDQTALHVPMPLGTGKKKRKKTKPRQTVASHHVDAVLSLSWNRTHRNLLASASADKTVKLWDLTRDPSAEGEAGGAIRSFDLHEDKVQAVQWNPTEPTVLLTGSYDRTVRTFDSRAPEAGVAALVGADVEDLRWDPFEPHSFVVSLENGLVLNFDARTLSSERNKATPARWTLSAHNGAASSIDINPHVRGCLATGGTDKMVKIWNIIDEGSSPKVSMAGSRDLGIGKVFSVQWSPDDSLTLAAAGSKAVMQIWDVGSTVSMRKAFGSKLQDAGIQLKERESGGVIGVHDEDEDEESGWEDDGE